ncbi:hypothetical protein MA16_Dca002442 [Dendrobium catenatum]|uniref:Uncharacterized protein n=1 Tax=Dendrobium catenatum TaxID=906689 RepID=A0A2I0W0I6_9ASPA|nr:hypothetical protein MA16_Dca002442 [Dendrobium catenatum]
MAFACCQPRSGHAGIHAIGMLATWHWARWLHEPPHLGPGHAGSHGLHKLPARASARCQPRPPCGASQRIRLLATRASGLHASDLDERHESIPGHVPLGAEASTNGRRVNDRLRRCIFNVDSDLEAFSHNLIYSSFVPLAFQPSAITNCVNQRFLLY